MSRELVRGIVFAFSIVGAVLLVPADLPVWRYGVLVLASTCGFYVVADIVLDGLWKTLA